MTNSIGLPACVYAVFTALVISGCKEASPPASTPAPAASASVAPVVAASAVPMASASTTAVAMPVAPGDPPNVTVECVAAPTGKSSVHAKFSTGTMSGTVAIDNVEARRFQVHAVPHSATYALIFDAYDDGDKKPASEKLVAGKSIVARIVANGAKNDLYLDGDVSMVGPDKKRVSGPIPCDSK